MRGVPLPYISAVMGLFSSSLRTVGQENVERYLHIPHAPFTARVYRTGDSFTLSHTGSV